MVRPAIAHPTATAHQPKSSDQKNSLIYLVNCLGFWQAFAYWFFKILFLALVFSNRDLFLHEIGFSFAQTVFGHMVLPNSK